MVRWKHTRRAAYLLIALAIAFVWASDQGIRAAAISAQMPAFGMIERASRGFWGHIEVLESDAERARQVIQDFFRARPERGSGRGTAAENGEESEG